MESLQLELQKSVDIIFDPKCTPKIWKEVDKIEQLISRMPRMYGDLTEKGTPGLYSRTLVMPKGMLCTSKIHATCHQFIISEGAVTVYNTLDDETILFQAGDHGITKIGTRRVLYCHEQTKWTTFHVTDKIKVGFDLLEDDEQKVIFTEVFRDIIQDYNNPLIEEFQDGVFI